MFRDHAQLRRTRLPNPGDDAFMVSSIRAAQVW
jgi:hypothetical protein